MELKVRPAEDSEAAYAWPMYEQFIQQHIYPKFRSEKSLDIWLSDEKRKFSQVWGNGTPYIVEVDGQTIGWVSITKSNNRITVDNVFIEEAWQAKGVGEKIFEGMIPVWKAEKRVVQVPVLIGGPLSPQVEAKLTAMGFSFGDQDGLVRNMIANWSN